MKWLVLKHIGYVIHHGSWQEVLKRHVNVPSWSRVSLESTHPQAELWQELWRWNSREKSVSRDKMEKKHYSLGRGAKILRHWGEVFACWLGLHNAVSGHMRWTAWHVTAAAHPVKIPLKNFSEQKSRRPDKPWELQSFQIILFHFQTLKRHAGSGMTISLPYHSPSVPLDLSPQSSRPASPLTSLTSVGCEVLFIVLFLPIILLENNNKKKQ